jgi:hypothetical protein
MGDVEAHAAEPRVLEQEPLETPVVDGQHAAGEPRAVPELDALDPEDVEREIGQDVLARPSAPRSTAVVLTPWKR